MSVIEKKINFNSEWKFILGDEQNAQSITLEDENWRILNLPHDWSIEFPFDQDKGEGCTGYLPGGIGWYRKHLKSPEDIMHSSVYLYFDGIYNHSKIFVNGQLVSERPNGYVPIKLEISDYLNRPGEDNVIAVRVDHSRYADSRWYTGSGIYRNVKLLIVDKINIPLDGIYVKTSNISDELVNVICEIDVKNAYDYKKEFVLKNSIITPEGDLIKEDTCAYSIDSNYKEIYNCNMQVENPMKWDIDKPNIYKLISTIVVDGEAIQTCETPFGFRTIEFNADAGFFLNGKHTLIKGVCLHHDGGLVGAAVPKGVWRRRFKTLKDGGCNAVRCAHNPPSSEFLDLCDEMGILVQNEFFDDWDYPKDKRLNMEEKHDDYISRGYSEYFQQWAEQDLTDTMLRDRNHPCIFQWSIGNEIEWTYAGNKESTGYFGADANGNYFWDLPPHDSETIREKYKKIKKGHYEMPKTAARLSQWVRALDKTRPVIANCIFPCVSYESGVAEALDIIGYSYRRIMYDYGHNRMPKLPLMGTENLGQWHEWKAVIERPFVSGTFLWTGVDYLGECTGRWPQKTTSSGLLDSAGFKKGSYHMMKTLWSDDAHIFIATNKKEESVYEVNSDSKFTDTTKGGWQQRLWTWHDINTHWNYSEAEEIIVEVYTNCETVELLLNGKSIGTKNLCEFEDHIMKWLVPYTAGMLKAIGTKDGKVEEVELITSHEPASIRLTIDKECITADHADVVHVIAQLVDNDDNPVRNIERMIDFHVEGKCKILGVDNGYCKSTQDYQSSSVLTHQGRCMMILQSAFENIELVICAKSREINSNVVKVRCSQKNEKLEL